MQKSTSFKTFIADETIIALYMNISGIYLSKYHPFNLRNR